MIKTTEYFKMREVKIMDPEGIKTVFENPEKRRTYYFPNGRVDLYGVTELVVRPSGTHRLKTKDGLSHIVCSGWLHIELDIENWSV